MEHTTEVSNLVKYPNVRAERFLSLREWSIEQATKISGIDAENILEVARKLFYYALTDQKKS